VALAFTTGTINQPDAGSVGLAMVEKLRDDVVAHPAWDLVEEFTAASGLVRWYVFKCLAAQSGLPADYFVVIERTLGSGELRTFICEGYTPATHTASFYADIRSTTFSTFDAQGRLPYTYVLGTTVLTSPCPSYTTWTPSGTSTKWWLTVDNDGFTVAFNGASNGFAHVGAYIPLFSIPNPMPICFIGQDGGTGFAGITRNPAVAGTTGTVRNSALILTPDSGGGSVGVPLGRVGRLDLGDKAQGDQRPVAEVGMLLYLAGGAAEVSIQGQFIGKHKRIRVGATSVPAGIAFGDAYALQGRLWVPYLPSDTRMWDTGVAV